MFAADVRPMPTPPECPARSDVSPAIVTPTLLAPWVIRWLALLKNPQDRSQIVTANTNVAVYDQNVLMLCELKHTLEITDL